MICKVMRSTKSVDVEIIIVEGGGERGRGEYTISLLALHLINIYSPLLPIDLNNLALSSFEVARLDKNFIITTNRDRFHLHSC